MKIISYSVVNQIKQCLNMNAGTDNKNVFD